MILLASEYLGGGALQCLFPKESLLNDFTILYLGHMMGKTWSIPGMPSMNISYCKVLDFSVTTKKVGKLSVHTTIWKTL
jgi:hypothetical protein